MGISGRIAAAFLTSRMTPLLALVAFLLGVFATLVTPREEEPQIDVTMANVMVAFPGASAKDVENLVARPAEQVLSRMHGVEHVYSMSRPGMAVITVQFDVGVKYNDAVLRLYDTVHSHRDWLAPNLGVMEPVIKPRGIDDVPIVGLTFWTRDAERSAFDLQQVARASEIELKRIKGTRDVSTIGGPDHAIRVLMDAERMNAYAVTPQDIAGALQVSNALQSSGNLTAGNREVLVQTGTYLESAADVKQLVVAVRGAANERKPVFLSDVATVEDGPNQPKAYAWFGSKDGEFPAVTLQISKQPGVNAADVANAAVNRIDDLKNTVIPEGVEVTVTRNYGETATEKAQKLIGKLIFATAFVVLLVFFALGKREAVIVGVAVTLTLAATLFASWAWGFTLNRVSLFALIFSIGILVDDAIVVVENIHRWQGLYPEKSLLEIIPPAVDEVGGPTILATLTVIAALLPMAFVTGLMGPYMSPIPINSSMGMAISLAVAFVVTPWLALKLMKSHGGAHGTANFQARRQTGQHLPQTADAFPRSDQRRRDAPQAGDCHRVADSRLRIAGLFPARRPQDAAFRQQERVPDHCRYAAWYAARRNRSCLARDWQRTGAGAGCGELPGLRRHRQPDQFQRSGPPVLPACRAGKGRHSGQSGRQAAAHAQESRDRHFPARPHRGDRQEKWRRRQSGRSAARPAGDVADRCRNLRPGHEGPDGGRQGGAQGFREDAGHCCGRRLYRGRFPQVRAACAAKQGGAARRGAERYRRGGQHGAGRAGCDAGAQYRFQVRNPGAHHLPAEKQSNLDALLKLRVRSRDGQLVPVSELVEVRDAAREKAIYHKDLLPVVYVVGDMGGKLDSPLYGMFDIRSQINGMALKEGGTLGEWFIRQPNDPYAGYSVKWDGEWQVTYETFRDMGIAYGSA
jgi:multidrug efflux pump subunit AcrB